MVPVWLTDTVTSDLNRALHYTQLWGLHGMELRTVGGPDDRIPFVNEKQIREQLEGTDLLLSSVVPSMFEGPVSDQAAWMNDLLQFEDTLELCRRVGCPRVTISPFAAEPGASLEPMAEALQQAGEKAAEYDFLVAVRNGPETACPTGQALARTSGTRTPANRRACARAAGHAGARTLRTRTPQPIPPRRRRNRPRRATGGPHAACGRASAPHRLRAGRPGALFGAGIDVRVVVPVHEVL